MAPKPPCRFYARGICTRGVSCAFAHDVADKPTGLFAATNSQDWRATANTNFSGSQTLLSPKDSRSEILCRFFSQGKCANGDCCPYKHSERAATIKGTVIEVDNEVEFELPESFEGVLTLNQEEKDNYFRNLYGTITQFEGGAQVSDVSLPSDFSAIHIKGLSLGTTPESVVSTLAELGVDVPVTCVRVTVQDRLKFMNADIRMKDPMFAKNCCDTLAKARTTKHDYARLEVVEVDTAISSELSAHRVDCRNVSCSWHKPSRVAWLNFGDMSIANRVSKKFNDGTYVVRGAKVICQEPKRSPGMFNPLAWTVFMTGLLAMNSETDILIAIRDRSNKPRHIEMAQPNYSVGNRQAEIKVKALLSEIGPLEFLKASDDLSAKRMKAIARFQNEVDAREAVHRLNGTLIPGLGNVKLSIQGITLAKFKIATTIYDVVQSEIDCQRADWLKRYINCNVYRNTDSAQRYTVIRISGDNVEEFGSAKDSLESILGGTIAMDGPIPIWTAFFNKASALEEFKKIQQSLGVHIVRDKRSQLYLYGGAKEREKARDLLKDMAKRDFSTSYVIELDQERFRMALSGKFQEIISVLGKDVASIDIASTLKRIIITGSVTDHQTALKILHGEDLGTSAGTGPSGLCPICCCEVENPVRTSCNHIYCLECLESQCSATASDGKEFSIICNGDSGRCNMTLTLHELQNHLSSTKFEDMLRSSFESYIRRRPNSFRHCPTTDCKQVYRNNMPAVSHTCHKCLAVICTSCNVSHPDISCAEHRYQVSGAQEAFENFKKENGFKDCPQCRTPIEKFTGCSHVTCAACSTHICWLCLESFPNSRSCYEHLTRVHGGFGDDENVEDW